MLKNKFFLKKLENNKLFISVLFQVNFFNENFLILLFRYWPKNVLLKSTWLVQKLLKKKNVQKVKVHFQIRKKRIFGKKILFFLIWEVNQK